MIIPLNRLFLSGNEIKYIEDTFKKGEITANNFYTQKVQKFIENNYNFKKTLLTTSATDALEMAFILLNLQAGDEVIMPSYTFVSTANAVMLRGAKPIFVDIDEKLNINPHLIENAITNKTKAILPVHYAGVACDMDSIMDIANKYNLYVVEDAAQGINAKHKADYLGGIGDLGCYSFHGTKNISSGEGGALLINSNDESILRRATNVWEKGTNRTQFIAGLVDKYTWVDIGSSFAPADILAAYLYAQLEQLDFITAKRQEVYENYILGLQEFADNNLIKLPVIPDYATPNYHIFYIIFTAAKDRDIVLKYLQSKGIGAAFHFIPLHSSPMGEKLGYKRNDFPNTEKMASSILRLPIYPNLTTVEQAYILEHLTVILKSLL